MPSFNGLSTNEEVVDALASQAKGRTLVITGAGHLSIGGLMAIALARAAPEHILIASRTAARVEPVLTAIREVNSSVKVSFVNLDLSDHQSVRWAAREILTATSSRIEVLINSAGVMGVKEYILDKQGIEMQLSTNHVGHFLLTNLLTPALVAAATTNKELGTVVVNLTSSGHTVSPFRFDDYSFSGGKTYDLWTAYGQSKTANILFSHGLTQRLRKSGVVSLAVHPGINFDTGLAAHIGDEDWAILSEITRRNTGTPFYMDTDPPRKSFEQIGAAPLAAALNPELVSKAPVYVMNCQVVDAAGYATDPDLVERLWTLSEELVGEKFTY